MMKIKLVVMLVVSSLITSCSMFDDEPGAAVMPDNQAIYWVAPEMISCQGVAIQQCLLVNQVRDGEAGAWTLFYNKFMGFDFVPGSFQQILVNSQVIDNPAADASRFQYEFVQQLYQSPQVYLTPTSLIADRQWQLKTIASIPDFDYSLLESPAYISLSEDRVVGFTGCNRMFGHIEYLFEADSYRSSLLKFGNIGSTRRACHDAQTNKLEYELSESLRLANRFVVKWPFLNIYKNDQLVLQFVAQDWD